VDVVAVVNWHGHADIWMGPPLTQASSPRSTAPPSGRSGLLQSSPPG
jgi:hypothetical protein